MTRIRRLRSFFVAAFAVAALAGEAQAASCGNGSGGFENWKRQFAEEARAKGTGAPRSRR